MLVFTLDPHLNEEVMTCQTGSHMSNKVFESLDLSRIKAENDKHLFLLKTTELL